MPHKPKPHGYDALDIWLATQDSANDALGRKDWNRAQEAHIKQFGDYATINLTKDKSGRNHFRNRKTGRFVTGY